MKTNKKYYKQKHKKKYTKQTNKKLKQTNKKYYKQTKKRNGGMLRKIASPVAKGVITIGTEYGKDQAQKVFRDKPNVLKDITNDRSVLSPNIKNIYDNNSENSENVTPNLIKKYLNKPVKIVENDENNNEL